MSSSINIKYGRKRWTLLILSMNWMINLVKGKETIYIICIYIYLYIKTKTIYFVNNVTIDWLYNKSIYKCHNAEKLACFRLQLYLASRSVGLEEWIQKSVLPTSFTLVMEHVFVDRYVNWIRFRDGHRKVLFHRHRIRLLDNVRHLCDINVNYRLNYSIYIHQSIKVRVI